jgi:hypothetical protein
VSAYDIGGPGFNLTGAVPEQVQGIHVSGSYFRLFGAHVILGRTFTSQEDSPNGGHVVVISYGFWRRRFGGNPHIVGTTLSLGNESYTIVGVIGKTFVTDPDSDLWIPFQIDPNSINHGHYFYVAARLNPGVTLAQANSQLEIAAEQFRRLYPDDLGPKALHSSSSSEPSAWYSSSPARTSPISSSSAPPAENVSSPSAPPWAQAGFGS